MMHRYTLSIRPLRWIGALLLVALCASTAAEAQSRAGLQLFRKADRAVNGGQLQLQGTSRSLSLDFDMAAFRTAPAADLRIDDVPLAPGVTVDLDLRSWSIIEPDANLVLGTAAGEIPLTPRVAMYRGSVVGDANSHVYLAVAEGSVVARVTTSDKSYEMTNDADAKRDGDLLPLISYPADALPSGIVKCGLDDESMRAMGEEWAEYDDDLKLDGFTASATIDYAVRGAWEGDAEYLALFSGNVQEATDYMVQVIGAVSSVYEEELGVQLTVGHLKLWENGGVGGYPYKETQVMSVALRETRDYWKAIEQSAISRTMAHTFSGKAWVNPIGIAFLDVLCQSREGAFSAITRTNTARDVRTVAHEAGHNLGSNHTHHCGWGGPHGGALDRCAPAEGGSCFSATEQEVGTIMSYCAQSDLRFGPVVVARLKEKVAAASCLIAAKKLLIQPNLVIFGTEIQGVPRDTVLSAFFTNSGQFDPITVTDVARTGANNDQFEIIEGMPPFTLGPGESKQIKVRFKAERTDESIMELVYTHNGLNPPVPVTFGGYASDIRPVLAFRNDNGYIDWGERLVGSKSDTVMERFFLNLGTNGSQPDQRATLYISDTRIEGPNKLEFQIVDGSAPLQLDGLAEVDVTIRYAPSSPGEGKTAWLVVESNSEGVEGHLDSFQLDGSAVAAPVMELAIPDLIIDFGDVTRSTTRDTIFSTFFRNAGDVPMTVFSDVRTTIGEANSFSSNNVGIDELTPGQARPLDMHFFANDDATPGLKRGELIVIGSDENVTFDISNDTIHLIANVTGASAVPTDLEPDDLFHVTPNPTTGDALTFFLAPAEGEKGEIFLISVIDQNGRELHRRVGTFAGTAGSLWQIDADDWAAGVYYLRVSTVAGMRARKITVVR